MGRVWLRHGGASSFVVWFTVASGSVAEGMPRVLSRVVVIVARTADVGREFGLKLRNGGAVLRKEVPSSDDV